MAPQYIPSKGKDDKDPEPRTERPGDGTDKKRNPDREPDERRRKK